jgi:hypothetical protein
VSAPSLSVDEFRRSPLAKAIAVLALSSQLGCYRTWTEPVAPPPLADSVTLPLERGHAVTVLQPVPDDGSAVDSVTLTVGKDRSVTLLRPEMESRLAVWGWTRDRSLRARTLVTSTGVKTLPGPDSVRVRVPLLRTRRELNGGRTALLVTGIALTAGLAWYAMARAVTETFAETIFGGS